MIGYKQNRSGFVMLWVTAFLVMIPMAIYIMSSLSHTTTKLENAGKSLSTKGKMQLLGSLISMKSVDVDGDGSFEPPKEAASNTIPAMVSSDTLDEWGKGFYYCTWDLGALNGADVNYSDNNAAPPITGMVARILSSGEDLIIDTACSDLTPSGDDIVFNLSEGTVISSNGSTNRWSDEGTYIKQIDPSDNVALGAEIASAKLTVQGDFTVQNDGATTSLKTRAYGYPNQVIGYRSAGTQDTPTAAVAGDVLLGVYGFGHDGTDFGTSSAAIEFEAVSTHSDSSAETEINFKTTPSGSVTPAINMSVSSEANTIFTNGISVGTEGGTPSAGFIRWNGTNFQGYTGSGWTNLDYQAP